MPEAPLTEAAERRAVTASVDEFCAAWADTEDFLGAEHREVADRTATDRWVLRFRGTEKDVIAIWLTLGQRTLAAECEVMPAPASAADQVHAYALARNAGLFGLAWALGREAAVYLVARTPAATVSASELDALCGAIVAEVEAVYPTVMTMGFPGQYRRRRRG